MQRRTLLKNLVIASSTGALRGQQSTNQPKEPSQPKPPDAGPSEEPELSTATTDEFSNPLPSFFSAKQFEALRQLSDILMPAFRGRPGALAAGVPEFLDFLLSKSTEDQQALYRNGLDRLNSDAQKQYSSVFGELTNEQCGKLLMPLHRPWTSKGSPDGFAYFLAIAKEDVLNATVNSREWLTAPGEQTGRYKAWGTYWRTLG